MRLAPFTSGSAKYVLLQSNLNSDGRSANILSQCSARRQLRLHAPRQSISSDETRLRSLFLHTVRIVSGEDDWYTLLVPRIGTKLELDEAVQAVVKVYARPDPVLPPGLAHYHSSLRTLQAACSRGTITNADLMIVGLCYLYEVRCASFGHAPRIQADGMAALLTSKRPDEWQGEIAHAIFYPYCAPIFRNTVLQGRGASPFDDGRWVTVAPPVTFSSDSATRRMRHLGHILLIRLPRLITLVRNALAVFPIDRHAERCLIGLGAELLSVEDPEAEHQATGALSVLPSIDACVSACYSHSHGFRDQRHFEALVLWWTGRLTLLRLCRRVGEAIGQGTVRDCTPSLIYLEHATKELCEHLLKSSDYTVHLRPLSRWPYVLASQTLYGALGELDDGIDPSRCTLLRTGLVQWYSWFLKELHMPPAGETALAGMSEILNGGRLPAVL